MSENRVHFFIRLPETLKLAIQRVAQRHGRSTTKEVQGAEAFFLSSKNNRMNARRESPSPERRTSLRLGSTRHGSE